MTQRRHDTTHQPQHDLPQIAPKPDRSTVSPSTEPDAQLNQAQQHRTTTFKGDVLRIVTGTGLSQVLGVLAAPILTRLYLPEAFGVAAMFASLTGILCVLACMRYEFSIVLPDNDREAANMLGVSLCFSVLVALLAIPIAVYVGPHLLVWIRMPDLAPYLWLIPISVIVNGIFVAVNYWNTRTKHFTRLSIARVTSSVTSTSANIGQGFAGCVTGGAMIAASVAGQAVATTVVSGQIWRDMGRFLVNSITWREMWSGMKRYKKFPLIDSWAGLLNTISVQLPTLLLGVFFSPVAVGFYALGYRLLQLPTALIGGAISQVLLQRASVAIKNGSFGSVVEDTFKRLLLISVLPFFVLMVIGPELFALVFGVQWTTAGAYVQILAPWVLITFVGSPLSILVFVLEKQEANLRFNLILIVSRIASLSIGGVLENPISALLLFSCSGTVLWLFFIFYLLLNSGMTSWAILGALRNVILVAAIFITPLVMLKWVLDANVMLIMTVAVIVILCYFIYVITRDERLRDTVLSLACRFRMK